MVAWAARRGDEIVIRRIWLALIVDVLALVALSVLASRSEQTWTTDVLVNGFFVVPMLATTQLRPEVGAAITLPTVAAYAGSLIAARHANAEPWSGIILSIAVLAALSVGSGFADGVADRRLAEGHIGLASQRIRIETADGSLSLRSGPEGTVANVRLPASASGAALATPPVTQA